MRVLICLWPTTLPLALPANAVTRSALECVPPESLESPLLTGQAVITALEATVTPEKRADLEGNVVILTPQRQLKADRATLDFENDSLTLIDNVSLIDADLCVNGRAASGNFFAGQGSVTDANFFLERSNLRGSADALTFVDGENFSIQNSQVTRCPKGSNTWQISSRLLAADRAQNNITIRNMVLRIKDLPVFYLPYMKVPINQSRQSGFLPIGLSQNDQNGLRSRLQYYINFAPNFDATLGITRMQARGNIVQTEFRSLGRRSEGYFNAEHMATDRLQPVDLTPGGFAYDRKNRGMVSLYHNFQGERFLSQIKFSKASDVNYFRDFESSIAPYSRDLGPFLTDNREPERQLPALNQSFLIGYSGKNLRGQIRYQGYQSLVPQFEGQTRKRPELDLDYQRSLGSVDVKLRGLITESETSQTSGPNFQGRRTLVQSSLTWPKTTAWGYLKSTIGFERVAYRDTPSRASSHQNFPYINFVGGSRLHRAEIGSQTITVLEPTVQITVGRAGRESSGVIIDSSQLEPTFDALFQSRGVYGFDEVAADRSAAIGVRHRWIDARQGHQWFSVAAGLAYFDRRSASFGQLETRKPLYTQLTFSPTRQLSSQLDLAYDPDQQRVESGYFNIAYRTAGKAHLSIAHRYRSGTQALLVENFPAHTRATQIAAQVPLGGGFSLRGLWAKNSSFSKPVESLVGVSYNSCCWAVEAAFRRYYDPKLAWTGSSFNVENEERQGVFLSVTLEGLMQIGSDMDRIYDRLLGRDARNR